MVMPARKKGVAALDSVNEADVSQEIQRTIDGYRCRSRSCFCQGSYDVVSAKGPVACGESLKHASSNRRQALPASLTQRLRLRELIRRTARMVVVRRRKDRHHECVLCPPRYLK